MKKIVMLLVSGFILISVAVALMPSITAITVSDNTSVIPAVSAAGLNLAKWIIPLAFGVGAVMVGIIALKRRK